MKLKLVKVRAVPSLKNVLIVLFVKKKTVITFFYKSICWIFIGSRILLWLFLNLETGMITKHNLRDISHIDEKPSMKFLVFPFNPVLFFMNHVCLHVFISLDLL